MDMLIAEGAKSICRLDLRISQKIRFKTNIRNKSKPFISRKLSGRMYRTGVSLNLGGSAKV